MLLNSMFLSESRALGKNDHDARMLANDVREARVARPASQKRERHERPHPLAAFKRWARAGQLGKPVRECCVQ